MYEALRALKVNGEIITSPITVPDCISTIIAMVINQFLRCRFKNMEFGFR